MARCLEGTPRPCRFGGRGVVLLPLVKTEHSVDALELLVRRQKEARLFTLDEVRLIFRELDKLSCLAAESADRDLGTRGYLAAFDRLDLELRDCPDKALVLEIDALTVACDPNYDDGRRSDVDYGSACGRRKLVWGRFACSP